jgi:oxygen-independent coproporphyrinogen-3 oxidase
VLIGDSRTKHEYMLALERELDSALPVMSDYEIQAVHVGGGSPSVMLPDDLARLARALRQRLCLAKGAEIGIEVMPQTVGTPCLTGLKQGGYSRVSLSVQSVIPAELEALGCEFTPTHVQNAVQFMQRFRFNDVNLDLMCAIPGQSPESWAKTLAFACALGTAHVSVYPFPGSGPGSSRGAADPEAALEGARAVQPDCALAAQPDCAEAMLRQAAEHLLSEGFERYTRHHFARAGRRSSFNLLRCQAMDYFGLGLSARSLVDGVSYANTTDIGVYLQSAHDCTKIVTELARLTPEQIADYRAACRANALTA